jgi:hypothetical protein
MTEQGTQYEPPQVEEIDSDGEPVTTGAGVAGSPG